MDTDVSRRAKPGTAEYWRDAYYELANGHPIEVRMPNGELDEIVGFGVFHVEQLDDNVWFFDLGGCRFRVTGKKIQLIPNEVETWEEEQSRVLGAEK